jgi:hypothetical protein
MASKGCGALNIDEEEGVKLDAEVGVVAVVVGGVTGVETESMDREVGRGLGVGMES